MRVLLAGGSLAPADPRYVDGESDELLALLEELHRVAPELSGVNFPHGRARALAVLRTLPTSAGAEVARAALDGDPGADV